MLEQKNLLFGSRVRPMKSIATDRFDRRLLELVNQERSRRGLNSLSLSQKLDQAADEYADRMARGDFFSHTDGENGSTVSTRVTQEGYQWKTVGENLAAGQTSPEEVFKAWMKSPGHRANIVNPNYTHMGVGYAYLANDTGKLNYQHYWTQVFAAGDPSPGVYVADTTQDSGSPNPLSSSPSTPTNLNLNGGVGNNTLNGGDGNDVLVGVDPTMANPGKGEIDILIGDQGSDLFVLGDQSQAYYNDDLLNNQGLRDYALIKDLKLGEDRIQLYRGSYRLGSSPLGMPSGTAIYVNESHNSSELIAIVEGISASTLFSNVDIAFSFV